MIVMLHILLVFDLDYKQRFLEDEIRVLCGKDCLKTG